MDPSDAEDRTPYTVVVNDEDQHSVWPAALPLPPGWHEAGVRGDEQHCLQAITRLWPDITPRSARIPAPATAGDRT
ncbi:MbtH family protein [Kitasatospora cineracea]|uniref:MbtH family protein n=1 Tax=Kitasatospora cineracea TaxID=88074 RepID=UPI0038038F0C